MSFMDTITNKYVLSVVGAVLALVFTYMYDKFERKDYSYTQYAKMAVVGYLVSLISVVVSGYAMGLEGTEFPLPFVSNSSNSSAPTQTGGSTVSTPTSVPQNTGSVAVDNLKPVNLPQPVQSKPVSIDTLDFRTGTPTF